MVTSEHGKLMLVIEALCPRYAPLVGAEGSSAQLMWGYMPAARASIFRRFMLTKAVSATNMLAGQPVRATSNSLALFTG
jgi:hypothetical protein